MAIERALPPLVPGTRVPMSYEDYLAISDEGIHAEWVNGEAIVFMPTSWDHQTILNWLSRVLGLYADLLGLGVVQTAPFTMRARPDGPAREPDLVFVTQDHLHYVSGGRLIGPADMVMEFVSPESVRRDRVEKRGGYAAAGIPEYWLIDARPVPSPPILYRLGDDGEYIAVAPDAAGRLHSAALPGFWLDPAWLIQNPLPSPFAILRLLAPAALRAAALRDDVPGD